MPSFLNAIEAHHESLNAAYSTYYAPGSSSTSPETSRNNSIALPSPAKKAPTNAAKAWAALKQHHADMNAAYTAYYSPGVSPSSSRANSFAATTPRHSEEHAREDAPKQPRNYQKAWKAVKNRAVEHHRSVNAAYGMTYGVKA